MFLKSLNGKDLDSFFLTSDKIVLGRIESACSFISFLRFKRLLYFVPREICLGQRLPHKNRYSAITDNKTFIPCVVSQI